MVKEAFVENVRLSKKNQELLDTINGIIDEYQADGYKLTLRQLYYQLVSRGVIPNKPKQYSALSNILVQGRMAGIVDWDVIEDRVRKLSTPRWNIDPAEAMREARDSYRKVRQDGQDVAVEIWCEKDALSNVLWRMAAKYGVSQMVNRGYASATVMYDAAKRFKARWEDDEQPTVVMYFGDHDPSGLDMLRDIPSRLGGFGVRVEVVDRDEPFDMEDLKARGIMLQFRHFGLTWDQIEKYEPPPFATKVKDARAKWYIAQYGETCWEVDTLDPPVLHELIETGMQRFTDMTKYNKVMEMEKVERGIMDRISTQFGGASNNSINKMLDALDDMDPEDYEDDDEDQEAPQRDDDDE